MTRTRYLGSALPMLGAIALLGCGSDEKLQPKTPAASQAALLGQQPQSTSPSTGSVQVDDAIAKACNLPTPQFAFDSTDIRGDAARSLDALARCFVDGPMRGRAMKLVGHADPRGTTVYNFGLGQERAGSVAGYLGQKGLSSERIATSSRGELDARGTDETSWAADRRVDVLLSN